jgi:hypothetical protein
MVTDNIDRAALVESGNASGPGRTVRKTGRKKLESPVVWYDAPMPELRRRSEELRRRSRALDKRCGELSRKSAAALEAAAKLYRRDEPSTPRTPNDG